MPAVAVGGAVAAAPTLAVDPKFAVDVYRPLGDRRPSSFCKALVAARMTVSSAP